MTQRVACYMHVAVGATSMTQKGTAFVVGTLSICFFVFFGYDLRSMGYMIHGMRYAVCCMRSAVCKNGIVCRFIWFNT